MKKITLKEIKHISHSLASKLLKYDEPIPDFSTRYPNILESCIAVPFQSYSSKDLYPGLINKTSIMFYLMVKNHPFKNGNKRIAMTSTLVLLYKNKKWLKADVQEFYHFTMWVADSPSDYKEETVNAIKKFLNNHLVKRA
ncbi:MAG: type II toxin-antitoxin system death-on-curing family toxin [Elusimicrobiota bacterium]